MRTKEQARKAIHKALGVPVKYRFSDCGVCDVSFECVDNEVIPVDAMFDHTFLSFPAAIQDDILLHEKGHIIALQQRKPAHALMGKMIQYGLLAVFDVPPKVAAQIEAEADLNVAKHRGLRRAIRMLELVCGKVECKRRVKYLRAIWAEQKHRSSKRPGR
jgi:hypothetical protein